MLNGNWKESSEGNIDIKDFDPGVVDAMLRFIYSFEYDNTQGTPPMIFDARMYQIADKYDIAALKTESKKKFELTIANGWATDDFPVAANLVYVSTPSEDRGLRDIVVETARKNIDQLVGKDGFCELTRETPDFAADLIPFLCGKGSASGSVQRALGTVRGAHSPRALHIDPKPCARRPSQRNWLTGPRRLLVARR
ncbi:hypothetical protein FPHYL_8439 [Fusarium phyllophilum]|uniref:BTB domain-containing protein n=1 Tax=Fusarium phyllophilum TaxID=47803 RepID=A0A8H5JFI2_9HYPO|nr:hypothetical protein FPHYL_8439 [Fusarium phyllophilum]